MSDDRLLSLRFRDLDLKIEGTWLQDAIAQVLAELEGRHIKFRPHFWLSSEWFSPDGIGGVAIPFYLAHPRLTKLERKRMLEAEGSTWESCLKILRHEVGHALHHAYRLQTRGRWRNHFGSPKTPYPETYRPDPGSRRFVQHLDYWYAQSHPDEDFAETFAVWLRPRHIWQRRYEGWPALDKLKYLDTLFDSLATVPPIATSRRKIDTLPQMKTTLAEHYEEKSLRYGVTYPDVFDRELKLVFSGDPKDTSLETAAAFLRRNRSRVRRLIARWTGEYEFTLQQVLNDMSGRCKELKLRIDGDEDEIITDFAIMLTVKTMTFIYRGRPVHSL